MILAPCRDYIQAAEDLGYAHVRILDHVLGAVPEKHPEVPQFPYTHESYIHEPFTLMAYLAAVTKRDRPHYRHPDSAPASDRVGGQAGGRS